MKQQQKFEFYESAGPRNDESEQDENALTCPYNLNFLSLCDRKVSATETEFNVPARQQNLYKYQRADSFAYKYPTSATIGQEKEPKKHQKAKMANRKSRSNYPKHIRKLTERVQELQRENSVLKRNQHSCLHCQNKLPNYYQASLENYLRPQVNQLNDAGELKSRRNSRDSLEFQCIDFHGPLIQTQEMQEKMWVFLGTILIAMGSKVMDFDGCINSFKILKNSVDLIRKQIEKSQPNVKMDFFCSKQELKQVAYIDGVDFDPFYSKVQQSIKKFSLDGVSIESVEDYELFYDFKYHFNIKYDALIAIMEYAKSHCIIA